ncbi:hypothetical protein [Planctomonas deserti]|uniref:hypothetical protein n=1 Tax=Planctomonas deserti TaxID=2144185 RepID=UPI00131F0472|nr:hypothetical protein [Planctomonas deserti]
MKLALEIDALSTQASHPWDLLQRLSEAHGGPGAEAERTPLLVMAERALAYSFEDDAARYGTVILGRRFSSSGGDWPPAFDVVDGDEKRCWAKFADIVTHPLPLAQFSDLALSTGTRSGVQAARALVDQYLILAEMTTLDGYYRASCLRRAWSLTRVYPLGMEADVRHRLFEMAETLVAVSDVQPGLLFRAVEPLAIPLRDGEFTEPDRAQVVTLLSTVDRLHGRSSIVFEAVHEVRERLAQNAAEREAARGSLVQSYLNLADLCDGFLRMTWLQEAASAAQRFGLINLRDTAVSALQSLSVDDFGFQSVTTEMRVPRHALDSEISNYRWSQDARGAIEIWLTNPAPTGSFEANTRKADDLSKLGMLSLASRTVVSEQGLPLRSGIGPEAAASWQLERIENMNAAVSSIVLANELEAIKTEYGQISAGELGRHLATRFNCDPEKAVAFGDAIASFWDGRFADAGRAAFPLVEAGARGLLLALGDPLFRIETGGSEGKFPSLETYLERLAAHEFDLDWIRTIRGPVATLRNALAHGHRIDLRREEAALMLRTAGLLVILTPPDSAIVDRAEVSVRLRDPIGSIAARVRLRRRWRRVWTAAPRYFQRPREGWKSGAPNASDGSASSG